MKIALITDQHFGGKQDSQSFSDFIEKFYTNQFFPYLKDNNISTVIDLGDTFDRRKYVNFNTLHNVKRFYFDVLRENHIQLHSIVGNHSTYYRNTNDINSSELLYGHYENVQAYPNPTTITLDGTDIDLLPWINSENYDIMMEFIKDSKSQVGFGHLEVDGFAMYKGYVADSGLPKTLFNRYEVLCSGHYHHKSSSDNIHYLGAPYEITWNDYDDPKGFHIFDTETRELTFIANPSCIFHKVMYNDSVNRDAHLKDYSQYKGCYLKVIVEEKKDPYFFDRFLDKLYAAGPANITVLEDATEYDVGDDETLNLAQDTPTLVGQYIDAIETEDDKSRLKKLVHELYIEALSENLING